MLTLQEELKDKTTIRTLPMDLAEKDACAELAALLKKEKPVIRILVNSAGLGHAGKLETQDVDQILNMIDVNCRALTAVTMTCLPYFRKGSRILQMDSGSAFLPQPGFAAYAASKAYVLSLSRALKEELRSRQISVTAVCPGPVKTDFFATGGIKLNPVKRLFLIKPFRRGTRTHLRLGSVRIGLVKQTVILRLNQIFIETAKLYARHEHLPDS